MRPPPPPSHELPIHHKIHFLLPLFPPGDKHVLKQLAPGPGMGHFDPFNAPLLPPPTPSGSLLTPLYHLPPSLPPTLSRETVVVWAQTMINAQRGEVGAALTLPLADEGFSIFIFLKH